MLLTSLLFTWVPGEQHGQNLPRHQSVESVLQGEVTGGERASLEEGMLKGSFVSELAIRLQLFVPASPRVGGPHMKEQENLKSKGCKSRKAATLFLQLKNWLTDLSSPTSSGSFQLCHCPETLLECQLWWVFCFFSFFFSCISPGFTIEFC